MLDRELWDRKLSQAEEHAGLSGGYKFVYGPWSTVATARLAFLSLNPGRPPAGADLRTLSDERGNSYEIERETTVSPMTEQFLRLARLLNVAPVEILTGVATPFRTDHWEDLSASQKDLAISLGREFWQEPLSRPDLQMIIAVSDVAARLATEIPHAVYDQEISANWGKLVLRRYLASDGRVIVHLPHLSRIKLLSRPESVRALSELFSLKNNHGIGAKMEKRPSQSAPELPMTSHSEGDRLRTIQKLPPPVRRFFEAVIAHPDFDCDPLEIQMTVSFQGRKVGGLNRKKSEWYVSKVFVADFGGPEPLERRGFDGCVPTVGVGGRARSPRRSAARGRW